MNISFEELGKVDDLTVFVLAEDHAGYNSLFWGQFGTGLSQILCKVPTGAK